jgi:hypothetical protein
MQRCSRQGHFDLRLERWSKRLIPAKHVRFAILDHALVGVVIVNARIILMMLGVLGRKGARKLVIDFHIN